MAKRRGKATSIFDSLVQFDARLRKRVDEFWGRVFDSPYGPMVQAVFVGLMFAGGVRLLAIAFEALSTGVIRSRRGGRIYLADEPMMFWTSFAWILALGAILVTLISAALWVRFGTRRGRRNAAQRRRRRMRKKAGG